MTALIRSAREIIYLKLSSISKCFNLTRIAVKGFSLVWFSLLMDIFWTFPTKISKSVLIHSIREQYHWFKIPFLERKKQTLITFALWQNPLSTWKAILHFPLKNNWRTEKNYPRVQCSHVHYILRYWVQFPLVL